MHEKEIENLKDKINNKDTSINELNILKDTHEQEIKNLKNQLILKEPKSRKRADHQGKRYVNLPMSKLNINSSKELISNIKQLINDLYDNEQITKKVHKNLIKAITYKNDS